MSTLRAPGLPASTSDASVDAWAQASNTGAKPSSKEASASSAACWALTLALRRLGSYKPAAFPL